MTGHVHIKPLDVPELADVLFYGVVSVQTEKVIEFPRAGGHPPGCPCKALGSS